MVTTFKDVKFTATGVRTEVPTDSLPFWLSRGYELVPEDGEGLSMQPFPYVRRIGDLSGDIDLTVLGTLLSLTGGVGTPEDLDELIAAQVATATAAFPTTAQVTDLINTARAAIIDGSPAALDTLNEIAAALGDDPSLRDNLLAAIAQRQPISAKLTTLAGLADTDGNIIQSVGGTWSSRTLAQMKASLGVGRSSILVDDYGAVGDGVTDDGNAIRAALTACAALGGGVVELTRGKVYAWSGLLTVPQGVTLIGHTTRQNLAVAAAPTVPGLVALDGTAQLRVGDWAGAAGPGGVANLYVDGNYIGGGTPTKKGLARLAGVNLLVHNLFVTRSAGDGIVFDGVQNSTVLGGMSSLNVGSAVVMDNGAGAITFVGGYYGTSKGGLLTHRDTAGEGNLYPFGPTQNTWNGTIFEAYPNQAVPVDDPIGNPFDHIVHISGTQNKFQNCNFTGGARSTAACTVLIDNTALPLIPTSVTFDNCLFWVRQGADAIRAVGSPWITFNGLTNVSDDGTNHAASLVCIDGGAPHISMMGEVNMSGDVRGQSIFRKINGGSEAGVVSTIEGGRTNRMRLGQVQSFRREGDVAHRGFIDRDFTMAWYPGTNTTFPCAYIQRGSGGTGLGLDIFTDEGGKFDFIGGPIHVDEIYLGGSSTPFDPSAAGGSGSADSIALTRVERQARQNIDTNNRRIQARALDSTVFTENWLDTRGWAGSASVASGKMWNAPAALSRGISLPVGQGRGIIRGMLTLGASTKYAYLGVSADAPGAAVNINNCALIGINNTNVSASLGANISGSPTNSVGGIKGAGDYLLTVVYDEESLSFSVQAASNPGVTIHSFSILRSQMPGGAVNTIVLSNNDTTNALAWSAVQHINEMVPPPASQQAAGLWGAAAPIHIHRKSPGHQTIAITGAPTGGSFTLTYAGQTTTAIPYNATLLDVKAALEALSTIGAGNASVTAAVGGLFAVRLKGALGLVAMTKTSSLTGGTAPDVTITQGAVRWFIHIPGDYDPRVPMPVVQYLHWSLSATGITPYTDPRMTATFNNLIAAGYAFMSSDNGPGTSLGGLQDSYGNQYGIDEYAAQTRWFRERIASGAEFLLGGSQGGIFVENILASRKANAVGNIAAVVSVSPARDLNAIVSNPTFTANFEAAYGATSIPDFATKVVGYEPIDLEPGQTRGVPHRDYVATGDTVTDEAVNSTPFLAALEGYAPEHQMWSNATANHLDTGLFTQLALDIVSYFNTYNASPKTVDPVPSGRPTIKRVRSQVSVATLTPNFDAYDMELLTAQAAGLTIANPTGTPTHGQAIWVQINAAAAQTLAFGTLWHAVGFVLPTTTVAGKPMTIGGQWNAFLGRIDVFAAVSDS